jgi:hypothetical protein
MILLGCLLAFSAAVAPRVILVLAWIFSDRWPLVWGGDFIVPLLGIIALPYTTIMYMLAWQPSVTGGGVEGVEWLWVLLGLFLDLWKYSQMAANRKEAASATQKYYPSGAPRNGGATSAAVSSGQVPPITSPTSSDADTAPTAGVAEPDERPPTSV